VINPCHERRRSTRRSTLYCTANGKALVAELPVPTVEATFPAQPERFTANTITTRREDQVEAACRGLLVELRS